MFENSPKQPAEAEKEASDGLGKTYWWVSLGWAQGARLVYK